LPQQANLIDAVVARSVDFENVHVLARRNRLTGVARIARLGAGTTFAIEGFAQNTGSGSLAHPAGTGKQVRMTNPIRLNRTLQTLGDMFLTDEISERLRAILSGDDLIIGRGVWANCGRRRGVVFRDKFGHVHNSREENSRLS
jgi:hypothetical protein